MKTIPVRGSDRPMLVDDRDYRLMSMVGWTLVSGYASGRQVYAHHVVMGVKFDRLGRRILPKGKVVDHINGNKLDNRRSNLRWVTESVNMFNRPKQANNTSGFKGVSLDRNGRWLAQIVVKGQHKWLGAWDNKEAAARAYDAEARKIPGAYLNFPKEKR